MRLIDKIEKLQILRSLGALRHPASRLMKRSTPINVKEWKYYFCFKHTTTKLNTRPVPDKLSNIDEQQLCADLSNEQKILQNDISWPNWTAVFWLSLEILSVPAAAGGRRIKMASAMFTQDNADGELFRVKMSRQHATPVIKRFGSNQISARRILVRGVVYINDIDLLSLRAI